MMQIPASMRSFVYDTQPVNFRESTTFFADEGDPQAPSATDWHEEELISWLMTSWQFRNLLFQELELPEQTNWQLGVRRPFLQNPNQKPGDIDLLLADPKRPHSAVAIETKRIKIRDGSQGPHTISKLSGFGKGLIQASALVDCGFSKTYLAMLAVVDGRHTRDSSFVFRGSGSGTMRTVLETPNWEALQEDAGVLYVEVVQPAGRSVKDAGMISLAHLRHARPRDQSSDMTNRIIRFFADPPTGI